MPSRWPSWISAVLLSGGVVVYAQDAMPTAGAAEKVGEKPGAAGLEPPPLVGWQDYNGPFAKTVGTFGRKLERKAVHPPRYRPGVSCARWNRELNSCCSYTTALTRFRYLPLDSMPGWTRPLIKTPRSGKARLGMAGVSHRILLVKPPPDSLETFPIRQSLRGSSLLSNGSWQHPCTLVPRHKPHRGSAARRRKANVQFHGVARHRELGCTQQCVPSGQSAWHRRCGPERRT